MSVGITVCIVYYIQYCLQSIHFEHVCIIIKEIFCGF